MKVRYKQRKEDDQWFAIVEKRGEPTETFGPYPDKRQAEQMVEWSVYDDDTGKPVHNYHVD